MSVVNCALLSALRVAMHWTKKGFEPIAMAEDQPHRSGSVGIEQRAERVPFDLKNPLWIREWHRGRGIAIMAEAREWHGIQLSY